MKKTSKSISQKLIWIVLVAFLCFFAVRYYDRITGNFRIANMTYEMPFRSDWEVAPLTAVEKNQLNTLLDQPFSYVGKGAQSYVFVSQDGEFVVKFFKFKHLKPGWWVNFLPPISYFDTYRNKQIARKQSLLDSVFSGYKLAYDVHKEQAGIVFLHLNKTTDWDVNVTLIDKIGRKHILDLDSIVFVIQERARTSRTVMAEALNNSDITLAKKRISQIFSLYLEEYAKGVYDRDNGVLHNTGFVGEKPIHFDVGKFSKKSKMKQLAYYRPDLEKIGRKYEVWLKNTASEEVYLELTSFIKEEFAKIFVENR